METCATRVRIITKAIRLFSLAAAFLLAHGAWAAQFVPSTGGDLDDSANWQNTTDSSYAVAKVQSGVLTISAADATLPNNGSLIYRYAVSYTNVFAAGYTLTVPTLLVERDAALVHKSGKLKTTSTGTSVGNTTRMTGGSAVISGENAELEVDGILNVGTSDNVGALSAENGGHVTAATLNVAAGSTLSANGNSTVIEAGDTTIEGSVDISNNATLALNMGLTVSSGGAFTLIDSTLSQTPPSSGTTYAITVNEGGSFVAKNSTISLANGKAGITVNNETATLDGVSISLGASNASSIGGDGGTLLFTGGTSTINRRFSMTGDDFTFCVSNATVNFSPVSASDLFITGAGVAADNLAKTLRFCGAAPRLAIGSSNGFHVRGTKGVTLQFDIGSEGFPTDQAVVEITNSNGTFKGDAAALSASKILVNALPHCKPGTYTLLKGKNAATFLTAENKWQTNSDLIRISAPDNDTVVATVKEPGLVIIVR